VRYFDEVWQEEEKLLKLGLEQSRRNKRERMTTIFCIGNGESRKDFDLEQLRQHGKIYGCNGLYRDFAPDVLVAMDYNICHEIYRSGYAFEHPVYLKQWEKNPASMYEKLFYPETAAKFIGDVDPKEYTDEWVWKDEKKNFFVCWANNVDVMREFRKKNSEWHEDDFKLHFGEDQEGYKITWTKKKDKVMGLGKYQQEKTNAGVLIALMAADVSKKVYLVGYDYKSKNKNVNNIYKGTTGYVGPKAKAIDPQNWIYHTKRLLNKYQDHEFIHVGENIEELDVRKNWTNISYEELNERIKNNKV
jgi:hypothetical protein